MNLLANTPLSALDVVPQRAGGTTRGLSQGLEGQGLRVSADNQTSAQCLRVGLRRHSPESPWISMQKPNN